MEGEHSYFEVALEVVQRLEAQQVVEEEEDQTCLQHQIDWSKQRLIPLHQSLMK